MGGSCKLLRMLVMVGSVRKRRTRQDRKCAQTAGTPDWNGFTCGSTRRPCLDLEPMISMRDGIDGAIGHHGIDDDDLVNDYYTHAPWA